ncbi:MAG: SbcC/MukB-like Walker B domain-containing protein, partial [Burkholderiales bacterium]
KRLGVGSNGEHLVPFYVIAGASLANAYRVKSGEPHDGAALMIIDEAFHGFDAQNAYVTAQFLRSLGLQLVMAAPDADVGKLVPVLDSYYDLDRFGTEVFTTEVIVKASARSLFESDMPSRNPHLVALLAEKLSSAA